MKLYAIYLFRTVGEKATIVDSAKDFSDVGWMYRKNCVEICDFASTQLAQSKNPQQRVSAEEKDFLFHAFRKDNVCAVLVGTKDYPSRAAFSILREVMSEYDQCGGNLPDGKCKTIQRGIVEYQNPEKADKMAQIHANLDQTREIMVTNLEKAIGRGESLNELAQKSETISAQSKMFAREASKLNSCCTII
ncbi:SNARE protein [Tritrichomonas foetus]|uniref:SNARE protein n=1 Tax=Tritrichomonas foetus TaxID=1144522 RepID=A0A1J4JYQ9_9EUKA|nr:SNARE protein [Tritrichomonas foetus]|eukprot:OHT03616.1 SNARE protein [Tritrichomonas foetus]